MFDYVIVGAGSAGCVLASRLTEDPDCRVLVLEAGGSDRSLEVRVPAAFSKLFHTRRDWNLWGAAEPQLAGRSLYMPRGRMLGGSSSMNAMIYIRGHRNDYDDWAREGASGWSFEEVLPYFRRAEKQARGGDEYHGEGGPLVVEDAREPHPLSSALIESAAAAGYDTNEDFNGARQGGFGTYQVTQLDGRRWSVADAYLKPALRRPNLTVRTGVEVDRILLDGRRAVGVEYRRHGRTEAVLIGREVLVAAGSLKSPQLLLLSGIGPAADLEALGLEVAVDLPGVGANLHDHPVVAVGWYTPKCRTLRRAESLPNLGRFLLSRRGPLTSNVAEAGGFVRSRDGLAAPDLQFHFAPALFEDHALDTSGDGFTLAPTLIAPRSRGHLRLADADPRTPPRIVTGQLGDDRDVAVLREGVKIARRIAATAPLADHCEGEWRPGGEVESDEQIDDFLRRKTELLYHPVGTCRMGNGNGAVVDPTLTVRGLDGLRVIDASVMPTVVRGNTNAPTVMIAEHGADLVRAAAGATVPREEAASVAPA